MNRLILMVGLPGSGKSTYAKSLSGLLGKAVIHSSDAIRKELYGSEEDQSNPGAVFRLMQRRARIDLQCGKDVIYDATNIKAEDRKRALRVLTSGLPAVEKIAVVMETDLETCKQYNASRCRQVPEFVYDKMTADYSLPVLEEGFDQVIRVQRKKTEAAPFRTKADRIGKKTGRIVYTGVFFDKGTLDALVKERGEEERLAQVIDQPHLTFQFRPQTVPDEVFGEEAEFRVVGYGKDGLNEGLLVEWGSGSEKVRQLFDEISIPHITLSIGRYGNAANTRYLEFKPIDPFIIRGTFGGFVARENRVTFTRIPDA